MSQIIQIEQLKELSKANGQQTKLHLVVNIDDFE